MQTKRENDYTFLYPVPDSDHLQIQVTASCPKAYLSKNVISKNVITNKPLKPKQKHNLFGRGHEAHV